MKIAKKLLAIAACLPFVIPTLAACSNRPDAPGGGPGDDPVVTPGDEPISDGKAGRSKLLAAAGKAQSVVDNGELGEGFYTLRDATVAFSGKFTGAAYDMYGDSGRNMTVSPISLYLALGVTAAAANGNTKAELLSALGVTESELKAGFNTLCGAVSAEWNSFRGENVGRIEVSNSIWLADGLNVKQNKLDELASSYCCDTYSADFADNINEANSAIKKFVKDKTHGLIDRNFQLQRSTVFALINTLYLKDIWYEFGDDIITTDKKYDFKTGTGGTKKTKLMCSPYIAGRASDAGDFTAFHARTYNGVDLAFMLPKSGKAAGGVFTADNFKKLAAMEYTTVDHAKKELYYTSCYFPKFKADFDRNVKDILSERFGVKDLFKEDCDMTSITDAKARCSAITHVTDLTVDKKGIEGAAVTVLEMAGTSAPGYSEYEIVREIFTVDRAFGFCISYNGVPLFTGVVNDIIEL